MAALGQTISGVAHELNNPLATILSWAERLSERNVDDKTKQGLEVILGESERAARIVRNLLTVSRLRTMRAARSDSPRMTSRPCFVLSSTFRSERRSAQERIVASGLFSSCATPEMVWPSAAIF